MKEKKYFILVQDNDCHWYVIPADKIVAWERFCEIPEDDEKSWNVPNFAKEVGGAPSLVEFSDYLIN